MILDSSLYIVSVWRATSELVLVIGGCTLNQETVGKDRCQAAGRLLAITSKLFLSGMPLGND